VKTNTKIFFARIIYFFLYIFIFRKKILVKRNNINWNLDLSEGIDLSIFLFGSFQNEITESILKYISRKKKNKYSIIDIGSNIGDKSLILTHKLINKKIKNFKIYSIEPTDFAFNKQIRNLELNPKLKKKISTFKNFISTKKKLPQSIYSSWNLKNNENRHKVHGGILKKISGKTSITTLDMFIKKNKIKNQIILKIDVDGHEMEVLKSFQNNLKKNNPVIFMEYAPYALKEHGTSVEFFFQFLKKSNYQVFDLNFNKIETIKVKDGSSVDLILIKNKKI
tara:strand:- start:836 stop:1675 length:840 start_codon:yes stop_codon:yes gene_type:complete